MTRKEFDGLYKHLLETYAKDGLVLSQSKNDSDLLQDNLTGQQRARDKQTTVLYRQFSDAHKSKQAFSGRAKKGIYIACTAWVSVLILGCIVFSGFVLLKPEKGVNDIVALIVAVVPMLTAILGTLNIVTKYVFPEDEEKHITEIVKTILDNDLLNKQENIKRTGSSLEKTE